MEHPWGWQKQHHGTTMAMATHGGTGGMALLRNRWTIEKYRARFVRGVI